MSGLPDLVLAPLVPWPLIAVPAALALLAVLWAAARRARGAWLRLVPLAALVLALLDPRLAGEEIQPIDDVAVVMIDDSASMRVADRPAIAARALASVQERLGRLEHLEVRVVHFRPPPGKDEGTRLFEGLDRALADVPRKRLAGVILLTDGQIHDVPSPAAANAAIGAPVHVLLAGAPGERDRRLVVDKAPSFGIVGRNVQVAVRIDDPGAQGSARVTLRRDGGEPWNFDVPVNQPRTLELAIEHGGPNLVEMEVAPGQHELSLANNRAVFTVNGVRDRLRVLLVSGAPHAGERTWRNLLKSDPSVDLVHFTILRPPEKDDRTPLRELALIAFPVRELFEEKLSEFDLVIFDRYQQRGILGFDYFGNIAEYVRRGGALLAAVGPEYGDATSIYGSPLRAVLPAAPAGRVTETPLMPHVTEAGKRHPVTADLPGGQTDPPSWGRWLRQVEVQPKSGTTVLAGAGESPLLVLDHVGEGRVALLASDTIWLWTRGWEGGGPQAELLRRLAHWLMKEPALEENMLQAEVRDGALHVTRRSLEPAPPQVSVTLPDGSGHALTLAEQGDGSATGSLPIADSGLYRVSDGTHFAVAAAGSLNPIEMDELVATADRVKPAVEASGGGIFWLGAGEMPDMRRVDSGRPAAGRGWIGLRANGDHTVIAVHDVPLMPGWALLLLAAGGLMLAWWREGR